MARLERISGMYKGAIAAFMLDGKVIYRRVNERGGRLYIRQNERDIYEDELPVGKVIEI